MKTKTTKIPPTPRPWHTDGDGLIFGPNPDFDPTDLQTHEEILIADVAPESKLTEEDKANADLIVRAVNHHENLVRALQDVLAAELPFKLNVRKHFSLMNARACASKALHNATS